MSLVSMLLCMCVLLRLLTSIVISLYAASCRQRAPRAAIGTSLPALPAAVALDAEHVRYEGNQPKLDPLQRRREAHAQGQAEVTCA